MISFGADLNSDEAEVHTFDLSDADREEMEMNMSYSLENKYYH